MWSFDYCGASEHEAHADDKLIGLAGARLEKVSEAVLVSEVEVDAADEHAGADINAVVKTVLLGERVVFGFVGAPLVDDSLVGKVVASEAACVDVEGNCASANRRTELYGADLDVMTDGVEVNLTEIAYCRMVVEIDEIGIIAAARTEAKLGHEVDVFHGEDETYRRIVTEARAADVGRGGDIHAGANDRVAFLLLGETSGVKVLISAVVIAVFVKALGHGGEGTEDAEASESGDAEGGAGMVLHSVGL